jgi:hypothetical protein
MKKTPSGIPALAILSVCITLTITPAWADDLKVFSNGSVADANDVNANFTELETRIETISLTPGEAGAAGAQGAQGNQGFIGITGATGAQGLPGNTGATGSMGLNGTDGTNGAEGETGAAGATGSQGEVGATGADAITISDAVDGDMLYWLVDKWVAISKPVGDAKSFSFCGGVPIWTQGGCIYEVGDTGPAGGLVIHITDGGLRGIESSPGNIAGDEGEIEAAWGDCDGDVEGLGRLVGDGFNNTVKLNSTNDGCTYQAAGLAFNYVDSNGFDDWYLPSIDELVLYGQVTMSSGFNWSSTQYVGESDGVGDGAMYMSGSQGMFRMSLGSVLKIRPFRNF